MIAGRKGTVPHITIEECSRPGHKTATVIKNLALFEIDLDALAHSLQLQAATSVKVADGVVTLQGSFGKRMFADLVEHYSVPKQYIDLHGCKK